MDSGSPVAITRIHSTPLPVSRVSGILGVVAAAASLISLLGWVLDVRRLADWDDTGIAMQPNAAVAGICMGIALFCLARGKAGWARGLGGLAGLLGAATLLEHLSGFSLGIDGLLLLREWGGGATVAPGRMGPPAATSFALLGIGMLMAMQPAASRARGGAVVLGLLTAAIAWLALMGYLFNADELFALPRLTAIAAQTAAILLMLGLGLVLAVPEFPPARLLFDGGAAGWIARNTLPVIVLLPPILGWLALRGQLAEWSDSAMGMAMLVVLLSVLGLASMLRAIGALESRDKRLTQSEKDRLAAEESVVQRERELRLLTDLAPVLLARYDAAGKYVFVNAAYAARFGKRVHEILGKRMEEILGPSTAARVEPHVRRALAGERTGYEIDIPESIHRPAQFLHAQYVPERGPDGRVIGFVAAITDITSRKNAEEALRVADRRKDEFLATLAHELRNPLAPVRNSVELMKRADLAPAAMERARATIERQITHMVRLIDDLLDLSRISFDKLELRRQRISLAEVVRSAVETQRPAIDAARHALALEMPAEPMMVDADPVRLAQAFGNLLGNAARYTPAGGRLRVRVVGDGGQATISIEDNGPGIPSKMRQDIFEKFVQVQRDGEVHAGGLGIGLTLVKRLVELHGGTVRCESEGEGRGSTFVVTMPLADPVLEEKPVEVALPAQAAAAALRVLVVDDNRDAADSLADLVRVLGHSVSVAYDGGEALATAAAFDPSVILLDIGLPVLDGYGVCRKLREQPGGREIRLVALTGWGQAEDVLRAKEAGFDHHLVKPADFGTVASLLSEVTAGQVPGQANL